MPNNPTPGLYRHYKGGLYTVIGVGLHTETEQPLVLYRGVNGRFWARPLEMWNELIDGRPRFVRLDDTEHPAGSASATREG